ncbi:imidazole glycerol phosphate synthase subunit HisF [soil metagenome]
MLKHRLIPVLLLQNGKLVRSQSFTTHQVIGNPIHEVARFNEWSVDELIYLDISRDDSYDQGRDDHAIGGLNDALAILDAVAETCFMPLTFGGRIRSIDDMRARFEHGADKITINTAAFRDRALITDAAKRFGSQAVVVSIDFRRREDGTHEVFTEGGHTPTGLSLVEWAREAENRGAGELLVQSIDRDGVAKGYDVDAISAAAQATKIPVIALGGVGRYEHYVDGIRAGASAVAAANIWHFRELADRGGKRAMANAGIEVRK